MKRQHSITIQCVETGDVYASISLAADDLGITPQAVQKALFLGAAACGLHFRRVMGFADRPKWPAEIHTG